MALDQDHIAVIAGRIVDRERSAVGLAVPAGPYQVDEVAVVREPVFMPESTSLI